MTEIEWQRLSSKDYEDMVAVLLSHKNPLIRRIDGAGGDGGRDAEFQRESGPEIYQLKSFTGRLTPTRRRQVKASLEKAAARNPVAWHLVVPIDPTPGEDDWFGKLQEDHDFPMSWEGRTWLNAEMAERPFIPRYFLENENERVVEILKELNHERAALTDIKDGIERLQTLADRINEIDPYYRFDIAVSGKTTEVKIIPRYEGAELDRPMTANLGVKFPDTDEGRAVAGEFRAAMDFGYEVEVQSRYIESFDIDAPVGLGGNVPEGAVIRIGPPQPPEEWEMKLVLRAITSDGVPVASMPVTLTERVQGRRGLVAKGSDRLGTFFVELKLDMQTRRVNLNFKFSSTADHHPHDLLPALAFMRGAPAPNRVQVLISDDEVPLGDPIETPNLVPIEAEYVTLVKDLARVQQESGTFFPMPAGLSSKDLRELAEAIDLLDGKEVTRPWTKGSFALDVTDPDRFLKDIAPSADGTAAFMVEGHAEANIADHIIPLGKMRTHFPETRITNMEEIRAAVRASQPGEELMVRVELEALGDKTLRQTLVPG